MFLGFKFSGSVSVLMVLAVTAFDVGSALAADASRPQGCSPVGKVADGKLCRPDGTGNGRWGALYRVLLYGDSLSAESARYVRLSLAKNGRAVMTDRSLPGSSPCDWKKAVSIDLSRGRPDAVVIESFGNNISACQLRRGLRAHSESTAYWERYRQDLTALVSRFEVSVPVWLTAPPAARNDLAAGRSHKARMLEIMRGVAFMRPNTAAIDAGASVEYPPGSYSKTMTCLSLEFCMNSPTAGRTDVRALDGLHFCPVIRVATVAMLRRCPVYSSGAYRFGLAQASPLVDRLGL